MMQANRVALIGIAITSYLMLCGNNCDSRPSTLTCDDVVVTVAPGDCAPMPNPCDDHQWIPKAEGPQGWDFCRTPPAWFSYRPGDAADEERKVCAAAGTALGSSTALPYLYEGTRVGGRGVGRGTMTVVVTTPMEITGISATPSTIDAGQSTQLAVAVTGGVAPFTFAWSGEALSSDSIANPTATPQSSGTYTVTVRDATNTTLTAAVEVTVVAPAPQTLTIEVFPDGERRPGQEDFTRLSADGFDAPAGTYTWSWTWSNQDDPGAAVDNPASGRVYVTPARTTVYTVTRTDRSGAVATGSVTVRVALEIRAFATQPTIALGSSTMLGVTVAGGDGNYTYSWEPAGSLNAANVQGPTATPATTTVYTVHVADGQGARSASSVLVTVLGAPTQPLVAAFSYRYNGVESLTLDASASTGSQIRTYDWSFSWTPDTRSELVPTLSTSVGPGTQGRIYLTITDQFGNQASTSIAFP